MSDDLVKALRESKGWPTLGNAAADRIQTLEADLAFYKGFHDGIHSTGTHVVVERTLLDECERAMCEVERLVIGANHSQTRYAYFIETLAKLRGQEKADD